MTETVYPNAYQQKEIVELERKNRSLRGKIGGQANAHKKHIKAAFEEGRAQGRLDSRENLERCKDANKALISRLCAAADDYIVLEKKKDAKIGRLRAKVDERQKKLDLAIKNIEKYQAQVKQLEERNRTSMKMLLQHDRYITYLLDQAVIDYVGISVPEDGG